MKVEIKRIKIRVVNEWDSYKNFSFITKGTVPFFRITCSSCLNKRIDYTYFYIIDKYFVN